MSSAGLQARLNRIWYRDAPPPAMLRGLSRLYGLIVALREATYSRRWRTATRLPVPVIVVGNLTVGGTGKTPLVCWLVEVLRARGLAVGVVSRGHGGSARAPRRVGADDDPATVGDEPLLIARRCQVPVAVARDRPAAGRLLVEAGCAVIVSDDGLQHHALARDAEIAVVDGERRFGNGWLLPAGPLRERPARLGSVDAVVVNGGHAVLAGSLGMRLEASTAIRIDEAEVRPLGSFAGQSVHAVAGIGNPGRFFAMLRGQGLEVDGHALADHARIGLGDISFADTRPVLMTEKDAVKCRGLPAPRHWYVPVRAAFDPAEALRLEDIVTRAMDRAPRN